MTFINEIYTTEVLKGDHRVVDTIAGEWLDLIMEGGSCDPFLGPDWFSAFSRNFEDEIVLVTVRKAGKLRAVLPLAYHRFSVHGLPVRGLRAVFDLASPRFGLAHGADETERSEVIKALWDAMVGLPDWDVIETRLVMKESWMRDLVDTASNAGFLTGVWQMDGAPFITLPERGDQIALENYSNAGHRKGLLQDLRRRIRRLQQIGEPEFVVTTEYSYELVQRYLELEASGWKRDAGTASILDPRAAMLHHDFSRMSAESGLFLAYELKVNDHTVAMSLNIRKGKRLFYWKTSYDEAFARCSPSRVLFHRLILDSIDGDLEEIDFLSPPLEYKLQWATGVRDHAAFYIFRPSIYGRLGWAWKFLFISRLRKFKSRF